MKLLIAALFATLTVGCSSSTEKPRSDSADRGVPQDNTSAPYASGSVNLSSPTTKQDLETSDVIAKKSNTDLKCPKNARIVNGKCVLKVEETDVTE